MRVRERECIVLYCIVLYCIVLYCIVLYCIVLYCIVVIEIEIGGGVQAVIIAAGGDRDVIDNIMNGK